MRQPEGCWDTKAWLPFRSCFPIRYFINDFELAITFDTDSDPSSRVVTGLPTAGVRPGQYGRDVAPEMLSEARIAHFALTFGSWVKCSSQFLGMSYVVTFGPPPT